VVHVIGKRIVESRPVTVVEVAGIMEGRLEDAKAEMKRKKKKPLSVPASPVPEPVPETAGEAAPAVPAPVEEEKSPLGLEQRFTLEYAQKFAKLGKRKAADMQEKLMEVKKMTPEAAVKIVDLLPANADQLKLIFAKEKITADGGMLSDVQKIVDEFRK